MRISYLKIAGFRGVKSNLELEFPSGFTVICGRNGSGKSTICDAFEYALTGQIRPNSRHTEKGESIMDYLWWRGDGKSNECYVSLGIIDSDAKKLEIVRSQSNPAQMSNEQIKQYLCDETISPPNFLIQLCRTLILRDEEITQLSVDLKETDRFTFARDAIGTSDFRSVEEKASAVLKILKDKSITIQREYEQSRNRISELTTRLSELKAEASKQGEVGMAERIISEILGNSSLPVTAILNTATSKLAEFRVKLDTLIRIYKSLDELNNRRTKIETEEFAKRLLSIQNRVDQLQPEFEQIKLKTTELDKTVNEQQRERPRFASLAELYEHGRRVGLENGSCPLCGSKISQTDFETHLIELDARIKNASQVLAEIVAKRVELNKRQQEIEAELVIARNELTSLSQASNTIKEDVQKLISEANKHGFTVSSLQDFNLNSISTEIESTSNKIERLEKALAMLEASKAYERLTEIEKQLNVAQNISENLSKEMQRVKDLVSQYDDALSVIRRVSGEIVDERLAELTPLMAELYLRLRPHHDWQELNYHLRGDVRRFLSLEVGEGLNPNFIFSSGQRRAVGLAFLLAVHLSRPWCRLQTLVLDDPVQHIDDFRTLHLTELLAAIRKSGRQIICTVEDPVLADLLCRRLRSVYGDEGSLVNLAYSSGIGVHVASINSIRPLASQVLLAG